MPRWTVFFVLAGCVTVSDADLQDRLDWDDDGHVAEQFGGDDCDDRDETAYPGAEDTWYDGADSNCDGANDFDQDGDGFESDEHGGDDCDDEDEDIHPNADEKALDGVDSNCNGNEAI